MDNDDVLMTNEMIGAMPAMQELQQQAESLLNTGISPNYMVILLAIIFMGKHFMQIIDKVVDAYLDGRKQKGE